MNTVRLGGAIEPPARGRSPQPRARCPKAATSFYRDIYRKSDDFLLRYIKYLYNGLPLFGYYLIFKCLHRTFNNAHI